jgi:hypothetical protein
MRLPWEAAPILRPLIECPSMKEDFMKEVARKQRNVERLAGMYPTFGNSLAKVISALEAEGLRPRIQDGWRSPEEQRKAFEAGHSKLLFGYHNATSTAGEPEALAADVLDDNAPLNPSTRYLLRLAAAAERHGLVTGIRWGLPKKLRVGIDAAIATHDWSADVKIGWDPTHVEIVGLSVAEVQAGKRPAWLHLITGDE